MPKLIAGFIAVLQSESELEEYLIHYCERFLEFLIDLLSQLPTRLLQHHDRSYDCNLHLSRRFFRSFLLTTHCVEFCILNESKVSDLFKQQLLLLQHYIHFEVGRN